MGKSTRITLADASAVLRLTHDVRDLRADVAAQHARLVDGVADLVGGHDAAAFNMVGFRRGGPTAFGRIVCRTGGDAVYRRYMADLVAGDTYGVLDDPLIDRSIDDARDHRTDGVWDVIGGERNMGDYPDVADLMRTSRFRDGLFSVRRSPGPAPGVGGDDLPVGLTVHRFGDARPFGPRDRTLLHFASGELTRLVGLGVLAGPAERPLPPRQAEVLRRVLAGQAPKEMAAAMGLSVHTVREHLSRLYARHGVEGREELTAAVTRPPG